MRILTIPSWLLAGVVLSACGGSDLPLQIPEQTHYVVSSPQISGIGDETGTPLDLRILEVSEGQLRVK